MIIKEKNDIGIIFRITNKNDKRVRDKIGFVNIYNKSIELSSGIKLKKAEEKEIKEWVDLAKRKFETEINFRALNLADNIQKVADDLSNGYLKIENNFLDEINKSVNKFRQITKDLK